jgi:hypothetical protein
MNNLDEFTCRGKEDEMIGRSVDCGLSVKWRNELLYRSNLFLLRKEREIKGDRANRRKVSRVVAGVFVQLNSC